MRRYRSLSSITAAVMRCIDRLDLRIEAQARGPLCDLPHLVSTVGTFHTMTGILELEMRNDPWKGDRSYLAQRLKILARVVRTHAVMLEAARAVGRPRFEA